MIKTVMPDVYIHSIRVGKTPEEDKYKSLMDDANRQVFQLTN